MDAVRAVPAFVEQTEGRRRPPESGRALEEASAATESETGREH